MLGKHLTQKELLMYLGEANFIIEALLNKVNKKGFLKKYAKNCPEIVQVLKSLKTTNDYRKAVEKHFLNLQQQKEINEILTNTN